MRVRAMVAVRESVEVYVDAGGDTVLDDESLLPSSQLYHLSDQHQVMSYST
jgi:hypothetical protein